VVNQKGIFPGIILIGIGCYFLAKQLHIPFMQQALSWPTLLLIIGVSFLILGYVEDKNYLFIGLILIGLGLHFHARTYLPFWVEHWAVYPFIVSMAYLVRFQKTKNGLIPGVLLLILALLGFFYEDYIGWLHPVGKVVKWIVTFWPVSLIAVGLYLLINRKKR
jgi:hypothetical protein